ncbi:MAG: hypothetical protein WA421_06270 [Nitrososphaeraceae archaeon]
MISSTVNIIAEVRAACLLLGTQAKKFSFFNVHFPLEYVITITAPDGV